MTGPSEHVHRSRKAEKTVVRFFSMLRFQLGVSSLEMELDQPVSMREIIDLCCNRLKTDFRPKLLHEDGTLRKGTLVLLEGKNVRHQDGLDTGVEPGSTVSLFPPSGGG